VGNFDHETKYNEVAITLSKVKVRQVTPYTQQLQPNHQRTSIQLVIGHMHGMVVTSNISAAQSWIASGFRR